MALLSLPATLTAAPPRLEARGLVVLRGTRRILDGADLRIGASEIACIEGTSGCGKTTFLRALATLAAIDAGTILLGGIDAMTLPPQLFRRRVAYVPQLPPMLEGTVTDNLATGPRLRGVTPEAATLDALLERVGLPQTFGARPARDLSGGERQRVAFARALANEPELLLLDEPTSALDPAAATHVLALVRELAGQGLSVIVVTHVEEHAQNLGGARYVCRDGRIAPKQA